MSLLRPYDGPTRQWCVMDLVTDHVTGKMRETLLWSNLFKACALVAYSRFVSADNFELMTLTAGGIFLAHEGFSRIMNQRQQKLEKETPA